MQLDQWQAKKCTIIEVESNQIKYEGAHIIRVKRSLAKEDGSETGIVSIGLVCRYHSVTSNADTPNDLGYNPPVRKYLSGRSG